MSRTTTKIATALASTLAAVALAAPGAAIAMPDSNPQARDAAPIASQTGGLAAPIVPEAPAAPAAPAKDADSTDVALLGGGIAALLAGMAGFALYGRRRSTTEALASS